MRIKDTSNSQTSLKKKHNVASLMMTTEGLISNDGDIETTA